MTNLDQLCINTIRILAADAIQKADSGHPGAPMGDADMAYILWTEFLRHNPMNPNWANRDRFVLSAGHASMLLYSLLHLTGYDISIEDIKNFRQLDSKTPGHPEYNPECGVEVSTGPLGLGFAVGIGMAIAEKYLSRMFNKPGFKIVEYRTYGVVSDGDIMEGVSYEAASIAGHMKLGNIIYLYSDNKTTIDGSTDLTFTENVAKRFDAMNWHVENVDGYDLNDIKRAINRARNETNRPSILIVRTHLGFGSPNKQNVPDIHGAPLGEVELKLTKENLGWPQKKFHIPKDALKHFRNAIEVGEKHESNWNELFRRYKEKYPDLAARWESIRDNKFKINWKEKFIDFEPSSGSIATRSASGKVINDLADVLPHFIGGSADLTPSNVTAMKKFGNIFESEGGRNIHFGVREHAMAAILSGMALSKMLIPFGGTYLVFSDYMLPAIRLAALMKVHVIYVLTHDSIGVGEDGPSHHPISQLTNLRAMPDLLVIRPADANEVVVAWEIAIEKQDGPIALIFTRQSVPIIDRSIYAHHDGLKKGAYVLADCQGTPELILIATGSEVHVTLEAYEELTAQGIKARLVAIPSFELYEAQSADYKESVLPSSVEKRLAVEAGATLGWYKYVGLKGDIIGLDRYGLSAPSSELFERFGFTKDNILKRALELLKK